MITLSLTTLAKVTDGELIVAKKITALTADDLAVDGLVVDELAMMATVLQNK